MQVLHGTISQCLKSIKYGLRRIAKQLLTKIFHKSLKEEYMAAYLLILQLAAVKDC